MSKKNIQEKQLQVVDFEKYFPARVYEIKGKNEGDIDTECQQPFEHWHSALEIVFTIHGQAQHYIDGNIYIAEPGSVLVINPESIHKVIPDKDSDNQYGPEETIAIVIHVEKVFMKHVMLDMNNMYFLPQGKIDQYLNQKIMSLTNECRDKNRTKVYEWLRAMGYVDEIMYTLCTTRMVRKEEVMPINSEKNLERLRNIMLYVEAHYMEALEQHSVAKEFNFSKEYFSRFFRKNTGLTFMEYVTNYRIYKAREKIIETDLTILDIALDCGFSDSRGLINAFQKKYGITPLQYRKKIRTNKNIKKIL